MLDKKYQINLLNQAYEVGMKFTKAYRPPKGVDHLANLEYLASKGLLDIVPCGHMAYEMKITFKGIEYLEEQKFLPKLRKILLPSGGIKNFIWGCITGACTTLLGQYLIKYLP